MDNQQGSLSPTEFNMREWGAKARISRENTSSRRYSASFIRSFREDTRSFRSNMTISSTASSPGCYNNSFRDEIDPSTYSFTTALQALQARSAYNCWECLSPEGFALNPKWNEAEKYICNPLSGEFPRECLSAKTLSGRSSLFPTTNNRITMSAPLIYSTTTQLISRRHFQTRPYNVAQEETRQVFPIQVEKRMEAMTTRDVGTQSTPPELSSSSMSPASTPSIIERSLIRCGIEGLDSPVSNAKLVISQEQVLKALETEEESSEEEKEKERIGRDEEKKKTKEIKKDNTYKLKQRRGSGGGGCLSWMSKRQRQRHNTNRDNKHRPAKTFFLPYLKGC